MTDVSPELQEKIRQMQASGQQLQMVAQQRSQMEVLHSETERAIEAIEPLAEDATVYRSIGALLVQEERGAALERLKDEAETLDLRLKRVREQEKQLGDQLSTLEQSIQKALQA